MEAFERWSRERQRGWEAADTMRHRGGRQEAANKWMRSGGGGGARISVCSD